MLCVNEQSDLFRQQVGDFADEIPEQNVDQSVAPWAPWNSMPVLEDLLDQLDARENCLRCGG